MEARRRRLRAVIGLLTAAFVAALALYLQQELRSGPWRAHVLVRPGAGAEGLPTVVAAGPGADLATSALAVGDRLVRVGARPLAGAAPPDVYASLYAEANATGEVDLEVLREGKRFVVTEQLSALPHLWRDVALAMAFVATALLVLRRAPDAPVSGTFAVAALVWGLAQVQFQGPTPWQTHAWFLVRAATGFLWAPLMILAAVQFPSGAWPKGRALPRWPWAFAVLGLTWTSCWFAWPKVQACSTHDRIAEVVSSPSNPSRSAHAMVLALA